VPDNGPGNSEHQLIPLYANTEGVLLDIEITASKDFNGSQAADR
jgi:hypothetical protein